MIGALLRRLLATVRDGFALWWLAPLAPLIAAVPELLQHMTEIRLGMFDSHAAFTALANDPQRWAWGYLKIAGLIVAIFASLRVIANRDAGRANLDLRGIAWGAFFGGLALSLVASVPGYLLQGRISDSSQSIIGLVVSVLTLPLITYSVAALCGGARVIGLRQAYRTGWWPALRMGLFLLCTFGLLQLLHRFDHTVAMGRSTAAIWGLMIWDSLVVGTMAAMMGSAMFHGLAPLRNPARLALDPSDRQPAV